MKYIKIVTKTGCQKLSNSFERQTTIVLKTKSDKINIYLTAKRPIGGNSEKAFTHGKDQLNNSGGITRFDEFGVGFSSLKERFRKY